MEGEGGGGEGGEGMRMVGTDGEGMEETDGGVLDLIAVHCCLLMVHQRRRTLLSLARCGPVLCLNEVGWGEGGTGGTYIASTMTNNIRRSLFWLPRCCR